MDEPVVESLPETTKQGSAAGHLEDAQRVAAIITRGQRTRPGGWTVLLLGLLSGALQWASFTPLDWGQLAWVSLVPLLCLVPPAGRIRFLYRTLYLCGLCYWLATLQWMRLGDPSMYLALLALAGYLAVYWPVFIWLARVAMHRLHVPLWLAAPVLWTGFEYLRGHLVTGFSWYLIGHTQYRWVDMIQIADLTGACGVSFLIVLANAALTQLVPRECFRYWHLCWPQELDRVRVASLRAQWGGGVVSLLLVSLACGYGIVRRGHDAFPLGPRVALIQGNYVASVNHQLDDPRDIFLMHRQLTGLTVSEQPDFVVWPEAMFPYGIYEVDPGVTLEDLSRIAPEVPASVWKDKASQRALKDLAEMTGAALVIGTNTFVAHPDSYSLFNSAAFVQPGIGLTNRYDKIHRVPFGEYIPLRESLPFLQKLTPFRGKFGIDQGHSAHVFRWRDWELIPIICFEDTVPHLVRQIARSAKVNGSPQKQILVNLTNDGWFHGSSELDQHLITSQFRAIETRTPLVRAVNTGISAVIDGDGVVCEAVRFFDAGPRDDETPLRERMRDSRGRLHKQLNCAIVADVPLDPRTSFYVTWGDWFSIICLVLTVSTGLCGLFLRQRQAEV